MNLVKTYLDKDKFGGIGLFAKELILKGTLMWEIHEPFDIVLRTAEVKRLYKDTSNNSEFKTYIERYAFEMNGYYCICGDDARFSNHSLNANTTSYWDRQYAKNDILPGEEIFTNYFEINDNLSEEEIKELNSYK